MIRQTILILALVVVGNSAVAAPDLNGIWMLDGLATEGELVMTDAARSIQKNYDLLVDDPSLACVPASISRVWANPNVHIGIEQDGDRIQISYELFDLRRVVPFGTAADLSDHPSTRNVDGSYFPEMGSSFARAEADRIFIETINHAAGFIRTSRGVPQSERTQAIEELWLDGEWLHMTLTYTDPELFTEPFVIAHKFRKVGAGDVPLYNCTDAGYDWFEKLNAPQPGESP